MQNWEDSVLAYLPDVFLAILILILFILLAKFVRRITLKFYAEKIKVHPEIASIIASIIFFFFILSGVFLALQILGLEECSDQNVGRSRNNWYCCRFCV